MTSFVARAVREATRQLKGSLPQTTVVADSGCESVNADVHDMLEGEGLRRILAQADVTFSTSMIEAFWRSLKHGWLYMHALDSFAALRHLIGFYVKAHNEVMPHAAFDGRTPDEMYLGMGDEVVAALSAVWLRRSRPLCINRARYRGGEKNGTMGGTLSCRHRL